MAAQDTVTAGGAKPHLSFWQIWNMCFGFLGLQFGFALQNANVSRIFQTLGAGLDQIPLLWIAAPCTGLLVQPLIGYLSDRTWTRLGRRRPYFLGGALLAASALVLMPRSLNLWMAAGLLWLLDAAINVSMEPFRAFVGDQLNPKQRPAGYAMQSFFIGVGAVVASMLPWLLDQAGVSNQSAATFASAGIPDTVRYAFEIGAGVLLLAILWTTLRSGEYPPQALLSFDDAAPAGAADPFDPRRERRKGLAWGVAGLAGLTLVGLWRLDPQLYLLCAGALLWGAAQWLHGRGVPPGLFASIMGDLATMPRAMRRLGPVQFFSWLALFSMWIYTTAAVAQVHYGTSDPNSAAFNQGANWVGVLFAAYNGFAALAALVIPLMVRRLGLRLTHLVNVWLGAAGLLSFLAIRDPHWLLLAMVGMGFAWASILSLPYALLSDSLPAQKMGLYMGVFNFFIVIPQLVAASMLGFLLRVMFGGAPIYALVLGGVSLMLAGLLVLRVPQPPPHLVSQTATAAT
ncbi:MAG: MFS transporter [Alphaproteobacteria bacterium 13_1_20CM_3_64_12]|nr:MAG: MFS transporter [Alphaproteobacteria bacterium 13_1_20CM_3_64_12]